MYPFGRLFWEFWEHRNAGSLPRDGVHVSHHRIWPWDIDMFLELNNGRVLTLYDLGRLPLAGRVGLVRVLRKKKWGLTMAGASVRYRARVRAFQRVEIRSRAVTYDDRFIYLEQSMWRGDICCSHILYRSAVTDRSGIVAPERVMEALGAPLDPPLMPDWVRHWIEAEAARPWPPEM